MNCLSVQRVLMTADTVGGVWSYALDLIREYESFGVVVALATMGAPATESQREELKRLEHVELYESGYKLEWMDDSWEDVAEAGEWLLELERNFEPDVIHLNGYAHGALPWRAPVMIVAHSCVLSWWRAVKGGDVPRKYDEYFHQVRAGLSAADVVVAPTAAMLDTLAETYGAPGVGRVIPNGANADWFRPRPKEDFILSAGRLWDEAKNVRAVCACSSNLDWPVFIAGEERHPDNPACVAPERGRATCLGRLNRAQIAEWLGRAAIFVHPAKYEPFGLSVLEAALCGCALVIGDIAALRENWDGAALFVKPDKPESALRELIHDSALRREMGRRARQRAMSFNISATAERYIETYASMQKGFLVAT